MAFAHNLPGPKPTGWRAPHGLLLIPCLLAVLVVAGCAQQYRQQYRPSGGRGGESYAPTRYYPPPGPANDPWGPYIREAAARYGIPEQWIRAVMAQESGGEEQAVSPVGAMGLMQIMPATYDQLRAENGLGSDPFDPRDNILAGAAYIQEMYGRYGSPGFLAAYNAGPRRLDGYIAGESDLPAETIHYLAAISPNLGDAVPTSGPLANYAMAGTAVRSSAPTSVSFAIGCDVNAAFDPDHPCTTAMANALAAAEGGAAGRCDLNAAYNPDSPCSPSPGTPLGSNAGACDLNRAYNPDNPCVPAAPAPVRQAIVQQPAAADCDPNAAYDPAAPCSPTAASKATIATAPMPPPVTATPAFSGSVASNRNWAIQVGAFSNENLARTVAEGARSQLPNMVGGATIELPPTTPFGGRVLYRARLTNLSEEAASNACSELKARQLPCIVVPASGL